MKISRRVVRLLLNICCLALPALAIAQDTRNVVEPRMPPTCTVLTARLAAPNGVLAEADESRPDTERIQSAIGGCPRGQAVELKASGKNNVFLAGPLSLKPGVTLLVDAGTALFASRNPRDYDLTPGSCGVVNEKGHGCKPFLNADSAPGSGIMGDGVIDGRGGATLLGAKDSWWDLAKTAKIYDKQQSVPRLLVVRKSDDFTLYRITLRNSPNFHVGVDQTNGFTAWGVKILTPKTARNTDGIDPSSSTNVTITRCFIATGDDNVAIKSGNAGPASRITVAHNYFYSGHGMSIGSGTSGGVSAVRVTDLSIDGADNGIRIKSDRSRGGLVQDVVYENVVMRNVTNPIVLTSMYTTFPGDLIPAYRDIVLKDVRSLTPGAVILLGVDERHKVGARFDNVTIDGLRPQDVVAKHVELSVSPRRGNVVPEGTDVSVSAAGTSQAVPVDTAGRFPAFPVDPKLPRAAVKIPPEDPTLYVAASGTGDYYSIQRAIDVAPPGGATISVAPGTYREVLTVTKPNIRLRSPYTDPGKAVIVFDNSAGSTGNTLKSATVNVLADDFLAENLTFANDYNRTHEQLQQGSQALALLVTGDRAVFRNMRILGNQDTLYAGSRTCSPAEGKPCSPSRQYFSKCFIEGNVDFIFGDAKAVFDGCEIHSTPHSIGFITAQGKNYPEQDSGFVFDHCRLTAEPGVGNVWLGRPWRSYASVVFLNTEMGAHIEAAGWREWHPGETNSITTSFYAEFNSSGPGGKPEGRDPHTRQLSASEAARYDVRRFLSGSDRWDPTAPKQPGSSAFSPRDKAAGVPINVVLGWPAAPATSYEVSFGTTNPPPFQCRVAGTSFVLETLSAGKTYYWRVDPVTDTGIKRGTVRRFTTARRTDRDAVYTWPIRIADSVRALCPNAAELGNWNYTDGIIIDALYGIASRTGRDDDFNYVRQYLDHVVSPEGKLDPQAYPFELFSLDRIRPASSLLWMYERSKEGKYLKAARYVATQLDKQPRTSDGGYWHRSTYPNQMWLDGIYMADVFAVQFGSRTNQPKYFDEAVKQITLIYRHTHDPKTGLCYHGWDETRSRPWANKETGTSPEFWGRAMGWYVMAMADVMDWLPKNHSGRKEVLPIFQSLCRSILKYQDRDSGMWYQIVDKPTAPKNYVETSCTLMYAYAMARGAQRGWLAPEYLEHARRATRGVLNRMVDLLPGNRMDIRGTVQVGSLGGDGGFYDYYVSVPVVTNDQKSIGAFMNLSMALSEIANPAVR